MIRRAARSAILMCAAIAMQAVAAAALPLRDYVETAWTHRDGISIASPGPFVQTTDGYLWFSAQRTLLRFDGVRFVPISTPCNLLSSYVAGSDGVLWILCRQPHRLLKRDAAGRLEEVSLDGLPLTGGPGLLWDRRGRLWLYGNVLARLEPDGRFRRIGGDIDGFALRAAEATDGSLWMTTRNAVVHVRDDRLTYLPVAGVEALAPEPSAGVLACMPREIRHLTDASNSTVARAPRGVLFSSSVGCVARDTTGALWAGAAGRGLVRIDKGSTEAVLSGSAPDAPFYGVFVDREGSIWAGSTAGLHRFRRPHARPLGAAALLPAAPLSLHVDSRDDVWTYGNGQLSRVNATTGAHRISEGWPMLRAFAESGDGRIWASTAHDVGYADGTRWTPVKGAGGAPIADVFAFTKDAAGTIWALSEGRGLYRIWPGTPRLVIDEPRSSRDVFASPQHGTWIGLKGNKVVQLRAGHEPVVHTLAVEGSDVILAIGGTGDSIWIGDYGGLWRWRRGQWTRWTRHHGLPGDGAVHEIASDRAGRLWLMTSGGIVVLSAADLETTPDGAPQLLPLIQIGSLDRVVAHPGPPTTSRVAEDSGGRLYFATVDSVVVVDPPTVTPGTLRPTIKLEAIVADNRPVDGDAEPRLLAPSRLEFDYTSLSLRSPEHIRFRYKLEGYDADWIDAGGARRVTYGTLAPGRYRFHVIGSGSEGVWNEEGASYTFEVVPRFHNTWWFRTLVLCVAGAAVTAGYRRRVKRVTEQIQVRFDERLAERTRIAQDLHDTLLQGTLAASLQAQLAEQMLSDSAPGAAARRPLQSAVQLLSRVAADGRATLAGLRTGPAGADLAEVLHEVARDERGAAAVDFKVTVEGHARPLQPHRSDDIQHIAREAIVNAYRHARARAIDVVLVFGAEHFRCFVRDDGVGMDQGLVDRGRDGHWGLTGMRERAERAGGVLHVRSSRTAGTEVEFVLEGKLAYVGSARPSRWPR